MINFSQRKCLFQSRVVRGCFTTPTAAFWGCWEHEHVLCTPCRRLQQEGCWQSFLKPCWFSFSHESQRQTPPDLDGVEHLWITSLICSCYLAGVKQPNSLLVVFFLEQLKFSAIQFLPSWKIFSLGLCRNWRFVLYDGTRKPLPNSSTQSYVVNWKVFCWILCHFKWQQNFGHNTEVVEFTWRSQLLKKKTQQNNWYFCLIYAKNLDRYPTKNLFQSKLVLLSFKEL